MPETEVLRLSGATYAAKVLFNHHLRAPPFTCGVNHIPCRNDAGRGFGANRIMRNRHCRYLYRHKSAGGFRHPVHLPTRVSR